MQKEVLILSSNDWNFLWQRHQTLASFFLNSGWKVVFVEGTRITDPRLKDIYRIIFKKILGFGSGYRNPVPDKLIKFKVQFLPPTYRLFRKINRKYLIPILLNKIKKAKIKNPLVIAYLPTDTTLNILKNINYSFLIYDCVVNFPGIEGAPQDIKDTERELALISDLIITDSDFLYKKMLNFFPEKTYQILPGVHFDIFSKADNGRVKRIKTLCFFGGINSNRLDLDMIFSVAKKREDLEFVFIGPIKSELKDIPKNVTFKPPVRINVLPEKLINCDCIILPYKNNEWTKGVIPSKIFESFATGKPVIVSGIEENISRFKDVLYTVSSSEEFLKLLEKIPELETEEKYIKRKKLAIENSWEKRFDQLMNLIEKKLEQKE